MFNIFKKKSDKKIFIKDRSSMYLWCNDSYAKDFGTKLEKIAGKSDYNFYSKKEAEKRIADEKKIIESGKVKEIDNKYETNKGVGWIKEILIPIRDGSYEASGILGISWDITNEKNCELEKERVIKEMESAIAKLSPLFENMTQGNLEEKIEVSEEESEFNELYNLGNSVLDSLNQAKEELQHKINQQSEELAKNQIELDEIKSKLEKEKEINDQKNKELEINQAELNKIQSELEQEKEKVDQKSGELKDSQINLNNIQNELEKEKTVNSQKEQELKQEKQKVKEANERLEEDKKEHKKFIVNLLRDLEEKIKDVDSV